MMYAIDAIVGLVSTGKVYNKWNSGEPDTGKVAAVCLTAAFSWW